MKSKATYQGRMWLFWKFDKYYFKFFLIENILK